MSADVSEEWRDVIGWEALYQVSNLGAVRSKGRVVKTKAGWSFTKPGRLLKQCCNHSREIYTVNLQDGPRKAMSTNVAWLVAEAFIGPRPDGMVVRHGAKGRSCNKVSNLSYGTQSQNMYDRWRDETMPHGSTHKNSKLSPEDVREIRKLRDEGVTCRDLSKRFGVCADVISGIHRRTRWAWVD